MNNVRKYFGIIWMLLSLVTLYFLGKFANVQLAKGTDEGKVFGYIIFGVLLPIIVGGLLTFGWYALQDEYKTQTKVSIFIGINCILCFR